MKNKHLKIAFIGEHSDPLAPLGGPQSGGQNVYIYELACALSGLGVKVDVFTRHEDPKRPEVEFFAPRARVIRLKAGPCRFVSKENFFIHMPQFVDEFLKFQDFYKINYQLIHSHYYFSGWAAMKIKEKLNVPYVATFHSLGVVKKRALGLKDTSPAERLIIEKEVMSAAEQIIAVSPDEKKNIVNEYQISRKKVKVIAPGVNFEKFNPLAKERARRIAQIASNKKIVVFAGKLDQAKGMDTLILAINVIKKKWPEIYEKLEVYMFSGDPRQYGVFAKKEQILKRKYFSLIEEHGLIGKVRLMPALDQYKLRTFFAAADVVVMPSLYETFGLVAVEAMATARTVIASNVGGLKWSIIDGLTGILTKPQDHRLLAKKIIQVLQDEVLAETLGINAYLRVRNHFNWFWTSREILEVYKKIIFSNKSSQDKSVLAKLDLDQGE